MTSSKNVRQIIRRKRRNQGDYPLITIDVRLLIIPQILKETTDNCKFLLYDSGTNHPIRILLFTTQRFLCYLNKSNNWMCDGTFQVAPLFRLVYTIDVIYTALLALAHSLDPETFNINYKTAQKELSMHFFFKQRWCRESKSKKLINQPLLIDSYNKSMCGVDLMDKLLSSYRPKLQSKKCIILSGPGSNQPQELRFDRLNHYLISQAKQTRYAVWHKNTYKL
ncbi:hypothetical protein A3Q56_03055 [Intoshia linei]|uniref:Uncharacterized protein n=1 Tax=Intoshia linei TaxID=1819745 RepID=A0A177B683_9BILA|nr:hypothetical protein A3Q56_03055 [Intoshia linei]